MKTPISVVINTLNEEKNIRNCLECVKWADEIIVIDKNSDDNTAKIASEYTDKIIIYKDRSKGAEHLHPFSEQITKYQWILRVDADELVTPSLRDNLIKVMQSNEYDVVWLPKQNYLFGQAFKGCGWGVDQSLHLRFNRKGFFRYVDKLHSMPIMRPDARICRLTGQENAMIHFNYIDFEHFIGKLNHYTTIEATQAFSEGKKFNLDEALLNGLQQVTDILGRQKGLQEDGVYGVGLGLLQAMYHFTAALKLKLILDYDQVNSREAVLSKYQAVADKVIRSFDAK